MMEKSKMPLPMVEGKCPPAHVIDKNGEHYWYYPEPEEYQDPEVKEYDHYEIDDKDEFYNYVTVCMDCHTRFIAYDDDWNLIRKYCPGCGKRLEVDPE